MRQPRVRAPGLHRLTGRHTGLGVATAAGRRADLQMCLIRAGALVRGDPARAKTRLRSAVIQWGKRAAGRGIAIAVGVTGGRARSALTDRTRGHAVLVAQAVVPIGHEIAAADRRRRAFTQDVARLANAELVCAVLLVASSSRALRVVATRITARVDFASRSGSATARACVCPCAAASGAERSSTCKRAGNTARARPVRRPACASRHAGHSRAARWLAGKHDDFSALASCEHRHEGNAEQRAQRALLAPSHGSAPCDASPSRATEKPASATGRTRAASKKDWLPSGV